MADDESSIEDNVNITHVNPVTGVTTVTLTPATRAQEAQVRFISHYARTLAQSVLTIV